jgi:hypothetical protein
MPKIEPMFASAVEPMTPSSKQRAVSTASMKRNRSFSSWKSGCSSAVGNSSARPFHCP